jgi:hypothetical protein
MDYHKFETHLSKTFQNASVEVDTASLIKGIHGELPQKKRLGFGWYFAGAFLLMALLGLGYFAFVDGIVSTDSSSTSQSGKKEEVLSVPFEGSTSIPASALTNVNEIKTNDKVVDLASKTKVDHSSTSPSIAVVSNSYPTNNQALTSQNQMYTNTASALQTTPMASAPADQKNIFTESFSRNIASSLNFENQVGKITPLLSTLTLGDLTYKFQIPGRKVECPDFTIVKKKILFSIIPELGAYYPIKSLINNRNIEESPTYVPRRDHEASLEGLAGALYLRASSSKYPMFVQSGLSYHRHTESMRLKYDYVVKDTSQGIISITVSQTGDTVTTIWGDIIRDKRIFGEKTVHHRFSLVDIPVGFGYYKNIKSFKVGLDAGAIFNISMKSSGKLFAGDTTFAAIDALPPNTFKKSIGVQYYAGIFVSRPIARRCEFYLNARMRFIPSPFTNQIATVQQKYRFAGLYAGLVFNLNH